MQEDDGLDAGGKSIRNMDARLADKGEDVHSWSFIQRMSFIHRMAKADKFWHPKLNYQKSKHEHIVLDFQLLLPPMKGKKRFNFLDNWIPEIPDTRRYDAEDQ